MFLARETLASTVLQVEGSSCLDEEMTPEANDALLKEGWRKDHFWLAYNIRQGVNVNMA